MSRTVLVADDESPIREFVGEVLLAAGYAVRFAVDGIEALNQAMMERPDLVLTDLRMPRLDGLGLVALLRERDKSLPIILMSATPPDVKHLGIDVLRKPFNIVSLVGTIEGALSLTG